MFNWNKFVWLTYLFFALPSAKTSVLWSFGTALAIGLAGAFAQYGINSESPTRGRDLKLGIAAALNGAINAGLTALVTFGVVHVATTPWNVLRAVIECFTFAPVIGPVVKTLLAPGVAYVAGVAAGVAVTTLMDMGVIGGVGEDLTWADFFGILLVTVGVALLTTQLPAGQMDTSWFEARFWVLIGIAQGIMTGLVEMAEWVSEKISMAPWGNQEPQ